MIGGFALLAYPAEYGNSGVVTFVVNHIGIFFKKTSARARAELAEPITSFNPDQTWKKADLGAPSR